MQQLEITREFKKESYNIQLTNEELELAYRIMKDRYLGEDFKEQLIESNNEDDKYKIKPHHLDEIHEIKLWLISRFHKLYDANLSHNEIISLTLDKLNKSLVTSEFFYELLSLCEPICYGEQKSLDTCESTCIRYYSCDTIALTNDRCKVFEYAGGELLEHHQRKCSCNSDEERKTCIAFGYINGQMDIEEFLSKCYDAIEFGID